MAPPLASLGLVIEGYLPAFGIGPVAGCQPVKPGSWHAETGVLHAKWLENAFLEERLKRLTRDACNQHAQHVGSRVVHPPLAWLVHERKPPQAAHPLIGHRQHRRT